MPISIPQFRGKRPKVRPELLDPSESQVAINCDFDRLDITPFHGLSFEAELNSFIVIDSNGDFVLDSNLDTVIAGTAKYMALIGSMWVGFPEGVDVVPAILDNTDSRYYYTGDGLPKQSDYTLTVSGTPPPYPNDFYRLGIPAPTAALSAHAGHSITAITKALPAKVTTATAHGMGTGDSVYLENIGGMIELTDGSYTMSLVDYTFTTNFAVSTENIDMTAHPFIEDDVVRLFGTDLPSGLLTETDYFVIYIDADNFELELTNGGGAVSFADDGTGTHTMRLKEPLEFTLDDVNTTLYTTYTSGGWANKVSGNSVVSTAYVYTYVTVWGEESAPSPTTENFDVDFIFGDTVTLSDFLLPTDTDLNIDAIRIYRVNSGTASSEFQFVVEKVADNTAGIETIDGTPVASYTYIDSTLDEDLGESLQSTYWDPPPAAMQGLTSVFNGVLGGFVGNTLSLSDTYHPYAWPSANEIQFPADIVGLGFSRNLIAVLTKGKPYMLLGSDPSTLSKQPLPYPQPCMSKRSIVSTDRGVIYASNLGLFLLTASGGNLLTKDHFTRQQWQALDLANISGTYYNDKYFGVFNGTTTGFILNIVTGEWTDIDVPMTSLFYLLNDGYDVYIAGQALTDYSFNAYKWDGGTSFLPIKWRSKKFKTLSAEVHSTGKIITDGVVMVKYYLEGVLVHVEMATEDVFRIPSRTRGREFEIELEGKSNVQAVNIGMSVDEVTNGS